LEVAVELSFERNRLDKDLKSKSNTDLGLLDDDSSMMGAVDSFLLILRPIDFI
jgi:hypothetical protein